MQPEGSFTGCSFTARPAADARIPGAMAEAWRSGFSEFRDYAATFPRWAKLFGHYDLVCGYATDGMYPMLVGNVPYVAFEHGTIRQITRVERPSRHHLYWPDLDVDLAVESLEHPEAYPLISQALSPPPPLQQTGRKRGGRDRSARSKDGRARRRARS